MVIFHRFFYVYQVGYGMIPQPTEAKHLFQVGLQVQHRLNAQDPGAGSCLMAQKKPPGILLRGFYASMRVSYFFWVQV